MVQKLTHDMARQLNLRKDEGVLISAVERGGPGETGGLRPGDVIYRFGMYEVRNLAEFGKSLEMTEPGDEAFLFLYRGGESYYTKIKVK
jgi:serine protease Do